MTGDKPSRTETPAWKSARAVAQRVVPERVLEKRRAVRKARLFREAGVSFIHVPRAAGTSITNALYGGHIGHFPLRDLLAQGPEDVLALPRFTIVRNPWERAVSAWRFARAGRGTGGEEAAIGRPEFYRQDGFGDFQTFVERHLSQANVDRLDPVFRTQSWYVEASGDRGFDHVGRFENLADTAKWLSDTLGRNIEIGHHNRSQGKGWREVYSPHARRLIGEIYAGDAERFGYALRT